MLNLWEKLIAANLKNIQTKLTNFIKTILTKFDQIVRKYIKIRGKLRGMIIVENLKQLQSKIKHI